MRYNYFNKKFFEENGFIILQQNIDDTILKSARLHFEKIYKKAQSGEYKYFRIYDDYLKAPNISGIEMIFHSKIYNSSITRFLNSSKIPEISKEILGEKLKISLSRYHVTKNYSHIGIWHRDSEPEDNNSLQYQYYLYDEKGLEIIPKSHNREFNKNEIKKLNKSKYSNLNNSTHLNTKAGDLLIFKPSLIHRGISKDDRVNIHFKIERDIHYKLNERNNFKDLNDDWKEIINNENSTIESDKIKKNLFKKDLSSLLRRILNTFMHYYLFFLPQDSFIFKKSNSRPSLKIRNLLLKSKQ